MRFGVARLEPVYVGRYVDRYHIAETYISSNERSAMRRARKMKREHPESKVTVVSLMPGDASPPRQITLVYRKGSR